MPLTEDKKYFIVNAEAEFKKCGEWLRGKFAEYPYLIITCKVGRDRTLEMNNKMWPMLTDISNQVVWFGEKHEPETWKDIVTGSFMKGRFIPSIEGGFVVTGLSTSKMPRKVFAELITYIYAFGIDKGVVWSEKSKETIEEYSEESKNNS
jgi:hypothetical protein